MEELKKTHAAQHMMVLYRMLCFSLKVKGFQRKKMTEQFFVCQSETIHAKQSCKNNKTLLEIRN